MSKNKTQDLFPGGGGGWKRCADSHPKLNILNGVLIGGNCGEPVEKAADVYVGFDGCFRQHGGMPWEARPAVNVYYPITDGNVPQNLERFKGLVDWVCNQLQAGKVVHMGCIGGHGRTGTVFAAIIKQALGEEDAITWVRNNYCKKAVETETQVNWLHQHFGIKKVGGSKSHATGGDYDFKPLSTGGAGNWWKDKHPDALEKAQQKSAARTTFPGQSAGRPAYDDGPASIPGPSGVSHVKPMSHSSMDIWTDPTVRRKSVAAGQ